MMMSPWIWGEWEQMAFEWPIIAFVLKTPRPNVLPFSFAERRITVWWEPKQNQWCAGYDMELFAASPSLDRVVAAVRDEWCAENVLETLNLVGDACD